MKDLTPLTMDRVAKYFDARGFQYTTDEDGDIYAAFENHKFIFVAQGPEKEVLAIHSVWRLPAPEDGFFPLMQYCNEWNNERLWPKTFVKKTKENMVEVHTEVNTDLAHGATDEQLIQLVNCGIATSLAFYQTLENEFIEASKAQRAAEQ
ncbi:YbjN domain-containing protein [Corynebacterium sp. HS2168-gen11]|uniref:YbjN domain-containing protein n=1 Tax=Corynebacterium sp. HS2168-gen11 TaxID=2974027 RepID=UPI00216B17AB|nr:YbjN domain-containing protein [Corynebacterium sp. HS2168-gen11]MCS4536031.1 YbjN domain-containing protein [Corynebacterium sp. HS2168-gen11]